MNTIKWDDFQGLDMALNISRWEPTNIECPKCNHLLERDRQIVLTTNPPKHEYRCPICGWRGAK